MSAPVRQVLVAGVFALLVVVGCFGDEGDAEPGDDDDTTPDCSEGLPEPSHPCLPECGNEYFVGQPCTPGGGECSENGFENAFFCTVDFDETDLWFCTMPCVVDEDCGTGAVCTGDPDNPASGAGCLPASCWDGDDDDSAGDDDDSASDDDDSSAR